MNPNIGTAMHALMEELFPICRSLTGPGVRKSFDILKRLVPLEVQAVPSGTRCFDWIVPDEWSVRAAYIATADGRKVIDFTNNNLHLVGYSEPVDTEMDLKDLQTHLHSLPEQPDAIPYRTSYYNRTWGFCLRHRDREALAPGKYRVKIDSTLAPGALNYAELLIPGEREEEVFLATNICHPSMANNELSGPVTCAFLARYLLAKPRRYTYRIAFVPETMGAIAYLGRNADHMKERTIAGFQVVCTGGPDDFTYLESRRGDTLADRAARHVLKQRGVAHRILDYTHRASDERQYCSPGIDLPVGSLMRSKYHDYPEYHTSLDNLEFVTAEHLAASYALYCDILDAIEANRLYRTTLEGCEPNLGRRGLYPTLGGQSHKAADTRYYRAIMAYADGKTDLLDIADKHGWSIEELVAPAKTLLDVGLIKPAIKNKGTLKGP